MKKFLLSASALVIALSASAQLNGSGDGYLYDNTTAASNCYLNSAPNNGGIMAHGGNFEEGPNYLAADSTITLMSLSSITTGANPVWFALPDTMGGNCVSLNATGKSVNTTNNSKATVVVQGTAGDTLEIFLGGAGQWSPSTSTYNIGDQAGSGIVASLVLTQTGVWETLTFDFNNPTDSAVWNAWAGKATVESVGFRTNKASTTFKIKKIGIGSSSDIVTSVASAKAASVAVYPNPASDVVNVVVGGGNASVQLVSLTGSVVASANGSGTVALSTAGISAGLYVVSVNSAVGTTTSKVVIK